MMRDGQIVLSRRLRMLADLMTRGYRAADVGCDHGFLSIYLIQQGISPRVLAMDVRKGPLAAAREHIASCGLEEYIGSRLSDGLAALCPGEAETLICAGMGGPLMEKILRDGMEKARELKELILQPQSEIGAFRRFLRREGFRILAEDAVCEDGKYYFAMKAVYVGPESGERLRDAEAGWEMAQNRNTEAGGKTIQDWEAKADRKTVQDRAAASPGEGGTAASALADEYGELLLRERHPVLKQYLNFRKGVLENLEERLQLCAEERHEAEEVRMEAAEGTKAAGGIEAAEETEAAGGTEAAEGMEAAGRSASASRANERLAQIREELRGVNEALRQWDGSVENNGVKSHFAPEMSERR